jgi:hypothetical protein
VSILDYNSLDSYQGPLIFVDGMSEIKFNGKKVVEDFEESATCSAFIRKQLRNFNRLNISNVQLQTIPLNSVEGLIYGPKSVTFKQYIKTNFRNKEIMK